MKRINKLSILALVALSTTVSSCSKEYGYGFENGYNSGDYQDTVSVNLDTNRFKIDYSKYTQARLFPRLMAATEPRLENFLVKVDLNFEEIRSADLRISVAPGNWQSTGVYAPAGELIVVDVPAGVYGLTAQISPHVSTSVDGIEFPQRDPVIFNRQALFPGKNYMRNLYGGLVYILPARPLGRIIDLYFSGVAKAPSFKLGETTAEEWKQLVNISTVPWFELEGRRIVFTMETDKLKAYLKANPSMDPVELMETWDNSIRQGYWDWTGMVEGNPDIRHRAPFNKWRIVHDVLFKSGVAQVSGYPVRARNNDNYFNQAITLNSVKFSNWGTYHELGHNMQMGSTWSFDGNGEVTNNLFSFKVSKLYGNQSYKIAEVWGKAPSYIAHPLKRKRSGVSQVGWAGMGVKDNPFYSAGNDIKLMMFAQIFEKYGYDFMTYIYKRGREARFTSINNQSKIDFFYEALSEFTQLDMEPYLVVGWGLFPSEVSKRYVKEEMELPLLNQDVWNFNPVTKTGGTQSYVYDGREIYEKVSGWTITGSSESNNTTGARNNAIDDVLSTAWTSLSTASLPHNLTVKFPRLMDISAIKIYNKTSGAGNSLKDFKLQTSADGTNFTDIAGATYQMVAGDGGIKTFNLPSVLSTQYIRLILTTSQGTSSTIEIAEIDFLGR